MKIFIIVFSILTLINYLIGGIMTREFNIKKWELQYEWKTFLICEIVCICGSILITHCIIN